MTKSLRPTQAAELLGVGRATVFRWMKMRPDFPKPRNLSSRCTVFDMDELIQWRDGQKKIDKT